MYTIDEKENVLGEVIEVVERHKTDFVGVIDIQKNFAFVSTANPKMYTDILFQRIN
jgi:ribonuclease R